jgi:hypothetical protein
MQDGKVETDDSGTFSHLKKSTWKLSYRPLEVPQLFPPRYSHTDPHSAGWKISRHLACLLRILQADWWNLTWVYFTGQGNGHNFSCPGTPTQIRTSLDQQCWDTLHGLSRLLIVLRTCRISLIWKKCHNPEYPTLFSECTKFPL